MTVGNPPTVNGINSDLQNCAVDLRNLAQRIKILQQKVVALGTPGLQNLGGPGAGFSAADAASVINQAAQLNNIASVYYGQTGMAATGQPAVASNYDVALTSLWGDQ